MPGLFVLLLFVILSESEGSIGYTLCISEEMLHCVQHDNSYNNFRGQSVNLPASLTLLRIQYACHHEMVKSLYHLQYYLFVHHSGQSIQYSF
jgi:hypothetical protein